MHYWHQSCHEKENNRFIGLNSIHNLRLDHNTPCLSPEFYITIVFKSFRSNLEQEPIKFDRLLLGEIENIPYATR